MDAKTVMEDWLEAIESMDPGRITGAVADDVSLETEIISTPMRGKQNLERLLRESLGSYESIRIHRKKVLGSGKDAAALLDLRIRFNRDLEMLGERLPTSGKEIQVTGAVFAEIDESGKIARVMRVRDTLGLVRQLELEPQQVDRLMQKFEAWTRHGPARAA